MRDEGFSHADIDTAILDDPKFRTLVRSARDENTVARCVVAYLATVTSSWARGERVAFEDAAPVWLTGLDDIRERLVEVGLLDAEGRIPDHAWESWYRPAWERRERKREGGRRGGIRSWEERSKHRFGIAPAQLNPSGPPRPSHPSAPSVAEGQFEEKTCPGCGDLVIDGEPNVAIVDRLGRLGHRECPGLEVA